MPFLVECILLLLWSKRQRDLSQTLVFLSHLWTNSSHLGFSILCMMWWSIQTTWILYHLMLYIILRTTACRDECNILYSILQEVVPKMLRRCMCDDSLHEMLYGWRSISWYWCCLCVQTRANLNWKLVLYPNIHTPRHHCVHLVPFTFDWRPITATTTLLMCIIPTYVWCTHGAAMWIIGL